MKDSFIKHLKPRKNSRYHQGYVRRDTLKKYFSECKDQPVIYRSGLELELHHAFDDFTIHCPHLLLGYDHNTRSSYHNRILASL